MKRKTPEELHKQFQGKEIMVIDEQHPSYKEVGLFNKMVGDPDNPELLLMQIKLGNGEKIVLRPPQVFVITQKISVNNVNHN